jgi:hypothetical protein
MIQVDRQHGDIEILRSKAAFDPATSKRRGAGTQEQASSAHRAIPVTNSVTMKFCYSSADDVLLDARTAIP